MDRLPHVCEIIPVVLWNTTSEALKIAKVTYIDLNETSTTSTTTFPVHTLPFDTVSYDVRGDDRILDCLTCSIVRIFVRLIDSCNSL